MEQDDNQNQSSLQGVDSQNASPQPKKKEDQKITQKVISSMEFERTKQRYEEQQKIYEKLQQQNQKLKSQLEELQGQLPQILENVKGKTKEKVNAVKEKNPLEIELNQKHAKIVSLQKDIAAIKSKMESNKNTQKIVDLENQIKLLDHEIGIEEDKKNTLQKIKNTQEDQINMIESQREYQAKINKLKEDTKTLRDQIRQLEKKEQEDSRKAKEQTAKLIILQQRYRETCKQLGISASINFTKAEEINQNLGVTQQPRVLTGADKVAQEKRRKRIGEEKLKSSGKKPLNKKELEEDEEDKKPILLTPEYYHELKEKIKQTKLEYKENIKKHETEMLSYQGRIKEMELEKKDLQNREKEKESEAKISLAKFNEYKRLTKQTSHLDYELMDKSLSFRNLQAIQKDDKPKSNLRALIDTKRRKTKREYIGKSQPTSILFDDLEFSGYNPQQQLSLITIFHSEDHSRIYGVQASYKIRQEQSKSLQKSQELSQQQEILGGKCLNSSLANSSISQLKIEDGDRLRFISGFARERIVYLKLETQNQIFITVGQVDGKKLNEFHLELSKEDVPILLFGAIDQPKQPRDSKDYSLVMLGFELSNPFHEYNFRQSFLKNQQLKNIKQNEIQEEINVEDESRIINARRGLFQTRIKPIRNQSTGKYQHL